MNAAEPRQLELVFWGDTFDAGLDAERLGAQFLRVRGVMADHEWHTLREIADRTGDPEASVSARIRQLRARGGTVERRRRGDPKRGHFEYRLVGK